MECTRADRRASGARAALMDVHAVNGGAACHWGGPAAFAEIMSAVHGVMFATTGRQWYEAFNFVNDAGHTENGIYALRRLHGLNNLTHAHLRAFRRIAAELPGPRDPRPGPPGVPLHHPPPRTALPQPHRE